jgi:hypothetical protein
MDITRKTYENEDYIIEIDILNKQVDFYLKEIDANMVIPFDLIKDVSYEIDEY